MPAVSARRRRIASVATIALLAAWGAAGSARAERWQVALTRGRDTLMVERWTRTPDSIDGRVVLPHSGFRSDYALALSPDERVTSVRSGTGAITDPDSLPPRIRTTMDWGADSVIVHIVPGETDRLGGGADALPYINPSMAMIEQMLRRARRAAGDSVRLQAVEPGNAELVPVRVRWMPDDSARVTLDQLELRFMVGRAGEILGGSIPAQAIRIFRVALGPGDAPIADYAPPPSAPYRADEVAVPVGGGVTLRGTLTRPDGVRSAPCALLVVGRPRRDRDASLLEVPGYRPFRQIADALARRGIATLRLDGRGRGGSSGEPYGTTFASLEQDARDALAWLRGQPGIDARRLALAALGEGGLVATRIAAADHGVRALVLIGAAARTGRRSFEEQQRIGLGRGPALPPARRDSLVAAELARLDTLATLDPWFADLMTADPLVAARRVRTPVLLLQGATDIAVQPEQAAELAAALRAGGDREVVVRRIEGADNLLLADASGDPTNYRRLTSPEIAPGPLGEIADWLAARLGARAAGAVSGARSPAPAPAPKR